MYGSITTEEKKEIEKWVEEQTEKHVAGQLHITCNSRNMEVLDYLDETIFSFDMSDFPGCCSSIVMHNIQQPSFDPRIVKIMLDCACRMATETGYTMIYATTVWGWKDINKRLATSKWKKVNTHINERTDNNVLTWSKIIGKNEVNKVEKEKLNENGTSGRKKVRT